VRVRVRVNSIQERLTELGKREAGVYRIAFEKVKN
jgi:hypothetical protein